MFVGKYFFLDESSFYCIVNLSASVQFYFNNKNLSINRSINQSITNIALGSEIKKQGRASSLIIISFYSGAERCKNKSRISIIAAEKTYSTL